MALDPFAEWLLQRAGLDGRVYRAKVMHRRMAACLRHLRASSATAAQQLIERRPDLLGPVLGTLLIGVSEFFRDRPVFDGLEKKVLPDLLSSRRTLRICSVGASGGQELYSVAMLLAEADALERADLIGIDCRTEAMARAAAGIYSGAELKGIDPQRRDRHFVADGARWRVAPALRARTCWRVKDVFSFATADPLDLVLFRNVTIYFRPEHAAAAWARFVDQLAPGGYLVTGGAEEPPGTLPLTRVAPSIFRKTLR